MQYFTKTRKHASLAFGPRKLINHNKKKNASHKCAMHISTMAPNIRQGLKIALACCLGLPF
jgi:hypothetical protein